MCWPHPAQVVLWQRGQETGRHMKGSNHWLSKPIAYPSGYRPAPFSSEPRNSEVDHVPADAVGGLLDGLGQRRVGVNGVRNLIGGQFVLLGQDEFWE